MIEIMLALFAPLFIGFIFVWVSYIMGWAFLILVGGVKESLNEQ